MKHLIGIFIAMALFAGCSNELSKHGVQSDKTTGAGNYSQGFRMGQLTKFSVRGLATKSGEGQIMMGKDGTMFSDTTVSFTNPWDFSAVTNDAEMIQQYSGQYVYVSYNQSHINNPLKYSTSYMLTDIKPVTRATPENVKIAEPKGDYSAGFRVGRFVKASEKGSVNKTYEMIFQIGDAGNQFVELSTDSEKIYTGAINWLKSGKKCKVTYNQKFIFNPLNSQTGYRIYAIEAMDELD